MTNAMTVEQMLTDSGAWSCSLEYVPLFADNHWQAWLKFNRQGKSFCGMGNTSQEAFTKAMDAAKKAGATLPEARHA